MRLKPCLCASTARSCPLTHRDESRLTTPIRQSRDLFAHRPVTHTGHQRHDNGEIRTGFGNFNAANDVQKYILITQLKPTVTTEYRQQREGAADRNPRPTFG